MASARRRSLRPARVGLGRATRLLEESYVALTPGEAFDAPGFLRISYATSMERLREGATRILDFVRKLDETGQTVQTASRA